MGMQQSSQPISHLYVEKWSPSDMGSFIRLATSRAAADAINRLVDDRQLLEENTCVAEKYVTETLAASRIAERQSWRRCTSRRSSWRGPDPSTAYAARSVSNLTPQVIGLRPEMEASRDVLCKSFGGSNRQGLAFD